MSAFRMVSCALSINVGKDDHSQYIERSSFLPFGPCLRTASSAEPNPNQPGKLKRLCIHEKTHGMARRSSTLCVALRKVGREPSLRLLISSIGVACFQNSRKSESL